MNRKIYIASSLKNYRRVLEVRDRLAEYEIQLTYDWADIIRQNVLNEVEEHQSDWEYIASTEYVAVVDAAALLFLPPAGRGGHFELGVAYARNIPVVLVEGNDPIAFYHLPDINRFKNEEEAISYLIKMLD
jgi:hypothetical protein